MSEQDDAAPDYHAIVAEHGEIARRFADVRAALESPNGSVEARARAAELSEILEAHFQREESLYYPTIWALRPDLKPPLTALVESHPVLRKGLEAITTALATASVDAARRHLDELAEVLRGHERAEERLLRTLDTSFTSSP